MENLSQMSSALVGTILFLSFLLTAMGAISVTFEVMSEKRKEARLRGQLKDSRFIQRLQRVAIFKEMAQAIRTVLIERNREEMYGIVFGTVAVFAVLTTILFLLVKQTLLAILAPFLVLKITTALCERLTTDLIDNLEEQLPGAIDNIIRISSKYGDLKSIIYESSRACPQPTRKILEDMSREMLSESPERVLMRHARRYDNVWFYSVIFTLVSYLEDASKEETLKNLKSLRDILDKENFVKKSSVTDRRYGVVVNLSICGLAIFGFFLNLAITPGANEFFFSTFSGLTCFVLGIGCVIITLFTSIGMTKTKKG